MTKKRSCSAMHAKLHGARQAVPHFVGRMRGVQQEGGAGGGKPQYVDLVDETGLVAGDEAGALDQVGRMDRARAEAQVRHGLRT